MDFEWLAWSGPVAIWWRFLVIVSLMNIALWLLLHWQFRRSRPIGWRGVFGIELMILLCAAYVFGCAFRSVLPRADVQRICLVDTWLSSVLVGRSVATIAEVCFAIQWAIVLRELARVADCGAVRSMAKGVVPLILLAECCSWYAVITTNYLGNAIENSTWAVAFLLVASCLWHLLSRFHGMLRNGIAIAIAGIAAYVVFLATIDVPMYLGRWRADLVSGKELLGFLEGLQDLGTRWAVTYDFALWESEIAWMSLYFSAAVWSSLALCSIYLLRDRLPHYLSDRTTSNGLLPVEARPRGLAPPRY